MASTKETKSKVIGTIGTIKTALEKYPIFYTNESLEVISFNVNATKYLLYLLKMLGLKNADLEKWLVNLIIKDGKNGFLNILEKSIKAILISNIKNNFSCSVTPFITDDLMTEYVDKVDGLTKQGEGIVVDISNIDFTGKLNNCPSNKNGRIFYFDCEDKTPSTLYKSRDFDAFLWYVINRGNGSNDETCIWDNRNKISETLWKNLTVQNKFFNENEKRKKIINCSYSENDQNLSGKLKILIDSSSYYRTGIKNYLNIGEVSTKDSTDSSEIYRDSTTKNLNKTIFEFNADYINSIELFDTKVLVAQLVERFIGVSNIRMNYSINQLVTQGKINEITRKIINADDTSIEDCFYSFSNEEYDKLLKDATLKHAGIYKYNNSAIPIDTDKLSEIINSISSASTLEEKRNIVSNTFEEISTTLSQDGTFESSDKLSVDIMQEFVIDLSNALIESILSPKMMLLFLINDKIMGGTNWNTFTFEEILNKFSNLINSIIKQIKDLILTELYKELISLLTPLIALFETQIALESVKQYKELLESLYESCIANWGNNDELDSVIDNVNYADIIPEVSVPNQTC